MDMLLEMALPGIQKIKTQGNSAWYNIGPLEPGYGVTIAHALKRVLLSSLPGAAITAIRLKRDIHESAIILGSEEEATDIILNVKKIYLRSLSNQSTVVHLCVNGKREVTAADITAPDTVEVLNPETSIAHLTHEDAHLLLELNIQVGRGYVPAEAHTEVPVGFIPIDAIYTPIRKVNYTVEATRVGKMVNFDKVLLEIETNGTLSPDEALCQSGEILLQQFLAFTTTPTPVSEHEKSATSSTIPIPWDVYNLPLDALNLPIRSYNSFKRKGITKAGQILTMSEEEFLGIRNIGGKSIPAIVEGLRTANCFPSLVREVHDVIN